MQIIESQLKLPTKLQVKQQVNRRVGSDKTTIAIEKEISNRDHHSYLKNRCLIEYECMQMMQEPEERARRRSTKQKTNHAPSTVPGGLEGGSVTKPSSGLGEKAVAVPVPVPVPIMSSQKLDLKQNEVLENTLMEISDAYENEFIPILNVLEEVIVRRGISSTCKDGLRLHLLLENVAVRTCSEESIQQVKKYFTMQASNINGEGYFEEACILCFQNIDRANKNNKLEFHVKQEIIQHALEKITSQMSNLTIEQRAKCARKAFSNPMFNSSMEKVESGTLKSILGILAEMSAMNCMINEFDSLANGGHVSPLSAGMNNDKDSDSEEDKSNLACSSSSEILTEESKKPTLDDTGAESDHDKTDLTLSQHSNLKEGESWRFFFDKGIKGLEGGEKCLFDLDLERNKAKKPFAEKAWQEHDPSIQRTLDSRSKYDFKEKQPGIKPVIKQESKSKELIPIVQMQKKMHRVTIDDIRKMGDNIGAISEAIIEILDSGLSDKEQKDLHEILKDISVKKSRTLLFELNEVKKKPLTKKERIKNASDHIQVCRIAEAIIPPSTRTLSEINENNKNPGNENNLCITMIHLLNQSVCFPRSLSVNGDPAKWTCQQLLAESKKYASADTKKQGMCVKENATYILQLFKLKQYPFSFGYDEYRQVTAADETLEIMAVSLYNRFIGKPLLDSQDNARLKAFKPEERKRFIRLVFGNNMLTDLSEMVQGKRKTCAKTQKIKRAQVCHASDICIALYNNKPTNEYWLVVDNPTSVVKIKEQMGVECFNQNIGSNQVYCRMGKTIMKNDWNNAKE